MIAPVGRARHLILAVLILIYVFNFLDRQIISILQVQIKAEFGLADWQLGLMTGAAFALVYSCLGIPIARLADGGVRRVTIISVALAFWSLMTALCGVAQTYTQLLLARAGVGVGEAGWAPSAISLISDLYPGRERARAMGVFAVGIPIGAMIGLALGGLLATEIGWRQAIMIVGLPGIVLAGAVALLMPEPARGAAEDHSVRPAVKVGLRSILRIMLAKPSYRHLLAATALGSFCSAGSLGWFPPFFARSHGLSLAQIGVWWGALFGVSGVIGMVGGGWLADRFGARDPRYVLSIPALAFAVALPFYMFAIVTPSAILSMACLFVPMLAGALWVAPNFALTQNLAPVAMRTTVASISLLVGNILGVALGPLLVGLLSDAFARASGDVANGLRSALLVSSIGYAWAALHFWLGSRRLGEDLAETRRYDEARPAT